MENKTPFMSEIPEKEPQRQQYFMAHAKEQLHILEENLGRPLTCCINTFGCQMNARDSEKLLGILETIGYQAVETEDADFVLYNTCTVRENANLRVYGRLGQLGARKKKHPHMMIALCGCMMQEKEVVEICKCPKCGKGMIVERKTKKGKIFYGCNNYPKCNYALWYKPTGEICPKCGELIVDKNGENICVNCEEDK